MSSARKRASRWVPQSGRGVSWCATCDGFCFRDRGIVVVVGGDTAMEATFLTRFPKSVTVVHRRSTLRASQVMPNRAFADDKISFAFDSEIAEIKEAGGMLSGLILRDVITGTTRDLDATGLFIAIGHDPRSELFKGQLGLDDEGYLKVEALSTRTNIPGVFAAGDVVVVVDHIYRQAITAAGSGCGDCPRRRAVPRCPHRRRKRRRAEQGPGHRLTRTAGGGPSWLSRTRPTTPSSRTCSRATSLRSSTSGPHRAARAARSPPPSKPSRPKYGERIEIVKMNIDENPETAAKYGVTSYASPRPAADHY